MTSPNFSEPGSRHFHLDGARNRWMVLMLVKVLRLFGLQTRFHYISQFVAGSQRKILPEVYQVHTPGVRREELEFFTTTTLPTRAAGVRLVKCLRFLFRWLPGAVIEVEQVVGDFNAWTKQWLKLHSEDEDIPFAASEIKFDPGETWRYEIHHAVNLPKDSQVDLENLMAYCEGHGMRMGGWFLFRRSAELCLRSNSFINAPDFQSQVEREAEIIAEYFTNHGLAIFGQWTLVEKVLLVWHSG